MEQQAFPDKVKKKKKNMTPSIIHLFQIVTNFVILNSLYCPPTLSAIIASDEPSGGNGDN